MSKAYTNWLKQTIAEMQEHAEMFPGDIDANHGKVLKALRIALASLEAEPVISHVGSKNALDDIVAFIKSNRNPTLKDHNQVSERLFQDNCHGLSNHVIAYIKQIGEELEELRFTQDTAPPAPVSVPDLLEQFAEFMAAESIKSGDYPDGWQSKASNAAHEYAQNIRAAMLQEAK